MPKGEEEGGPARVSMDEGVDRQFRVLRQYAKEKGYVVSAEHCDRGVSRNRDLDDCPGLADAIYATKRGNVLVVPSVDRLGSGYKPLIVSHTIEKKGAWLEFASGSALPEDPLVRPIVLAAFNLVNEVQRREIGARVRAFHKRSRDLGKRVGRKDRVPYGKMLHPDDPDQLIDNVAEMAVIGIMESLRNAGMSHEKIAGHMNAHGHPLRGKPLTRQRVWNVFESMKRERGGL